MAENKKETPKPRLTVAELKEIVARHVAGLSLRIDELEALSLKRKIPGMARQITRLHAQYAQLNALVQRLSARTVNQFSEDGIRAELEKLLNGQLQELNTAINEKFSEIDSRLDAHDTRLDDHDAKLLSQQAQIDGATAVGNANLADIRSMKTRITEIGGDNLPKAAVPWAIVSFIGISALVGYLLWLQPAIVTFDTLSDGVTKVPTTWAPLHDYGSWIIGVMVGALVAALILMLAKRRQSSTTIDTTSTQVPIYRDVPPAGYPGVPTAPTKVMQTTGVGNDAR